jgi:hypothetical protein
MSSDIYPRFENRSAFIFQIQTALEKQNCTKDKDTALLTTCNY